MIKKVCFITNYNLYETKRRFTEHFAKAMERKGIETKIIDVEETSLSPNSITEIKQFEPDLTASFNTLLPLSDKRFLWDLIKIPHWSILVDPSLYSVSLVNSPYSIISCVDHFDCQGLQSMKFDRAFFLAHAIDKDISFDPNQKRDLDVVFLGSCFDYESMRAHWQEILTKAQCEVLENAIDLVLADNHTPLQEALVTAWNSANLFASEDVDFVTLFYFLDTYTRGKDRVELIRSIKDANVHIFGELQDNNIYEKHGWGHYVGAQKNVTLHDSVPFDEALEILKRAKICLNSNPFFKNGSHERIFTSAACGALPVTMDNLYVREHFKPDDMLFYQHKTLDTLNEQVNSILADEKKRQAMAESARKKVMQEHTWDSRVEQMLEHVPGILKGMPV